MGIAPASRCRAAAELSVGALKLTQIINK